jgi:heat shock protein HtpX
MNVLRTVFLLTLLTVILVAVGRVVAGPTGMMVALAVGLGLNFVNYWFADKIVLGVYGARVLDPGEIPWLEADVRDLSLAAGIPMPRLAVVPKETPNAFATGRDPKHAVVAVTDGLLRLLDRRQVRAVIGHELGHVRNRDMLTMTLVAGAVSTISLLAQMAFFFGGRRDSRDGGNPLAAILVMLLAPFAAMLVQMAISRTREYGADDTGADLSKDPGALADALERLHQAIPVMPPLSRTGATAHMMIANPFHGMRDLFSTHPAPEKRIARLREMEAGRR